MSSQLEASRSLSDLLREGRQWTAEESVRLVRDLAEQVGGWHAEGKLHRAVRPDRIVVGDGCRVALLPPEGPFLVGRSGFDPERYPPELSQVADRELPESIAAAAEALADVPGGCDPRRIDLYPLGVVLWRLLTNTPVRNYLYDATARFDAPEVLQPVLDHVLGFDTTERIVDHAELAAALKKAASAMWAAAPTQVMSVVSGAAAESSRPSKKLPFSQLGPYKILRLIGRGGMGEVYQAYEESLKRLVAIKVLLPELAVQPKFVERFRAEAAAAARVTHPNVIPIYQINEQDGYHYFAMQFVEGESLAQRLQRGLLPLDEAVDVIQQCLAGLSAAHAEGLIHRDIKPANVLLESPSGRAVLVDFGLARYVQDESRITVAGVILGTVAYLSPEQIRGLPLDARSDLYSLGVLIYELLTRQLPFQAESPTAVIFQQAYESPRPLSEIKPDLPGPLVAIVERLLAKDLPDRYPSGEAVLADLQAYREGRPLAPPPADPSPATNAVPAAVEPRVAGRRPMWPWLLAVSLTAAMTAIVVPPAWRSQRDVAPPAPALSATPAPAASPDRPTASAPAAFDNRPLIVDLIAALNLAPDALVGTWAREGKSVYHTSRNYAKLQICPQVPDEYDVLIEARRDTGQGMLGLVCSTCGRRFAVVVDANQNKQAVIALVDGKQWVGSNERVFDDDLPHRLTYRIRKSGVRLIVDGKTLIDWTGDLSRLSLAEDVGQPRSLVLYTQRPFHFDRLELSFQQPASK